MEEINISDLSLLEIADKVDQIFHKYKDKNLSKQDKKELRKIYKEYTELYNKRVKFEAFKTEL